MHSTRFVVAAVVTTTTTTTTTTIVMPFCRCCTTIWMTVVDFAMNFKPLRRVDQVVYTLAYILCELRCQFRVCSLLCRDNVYNVNWCIWLGALNCAWWLVQSRRTDLLEHVDPVTRRVISDDELTAELMRCNVASLLRTTVECCQIFVVNCLSDVICCILMRCLLLH